MPLQPDPNPNYWPLLLTDELYLLPGDLQQLPPANAETQKQEMPNGATTQEASPAEKTPSTTQTTTAAAPKPDLLWGSLERGILILVDYPEHALMERTDGLFLVEILKAVGFDFKQVATLNVCKCKSRADWEWVRSLDWKWAISFGVNHPELPYTLDAAYYQKITFENRHILTAENLSSIRSDQGRKKQLWNLLRQAFV